MRRCEFNRSYKHQKDIVRKWLKLAKESRGTYLYKGRVRRLEHEMRVLMILSVRYGYNHKDDVVCI